MNSEGEMPVPVLTSLRPPVFLRLLEYQSGIMFLTTNRLLDLVDPDDAALAAVSSAKSDAPGKSSAPGQKAKAEHAESGEPVDHVATGEDGVSEHDEGVTDHEDKDAALDLISKTCRLFIRNLPYTAREDDLLDYLGKSGPIQEVRRRSLFVAARCPACDELQIGTSYVSGM